MDRVQQKGKKGKSSFKEDFKIFKENLKIREILRTVKMNNSMRLKAPPGSKVMDNKDFIDNEDILEESIVTGDQEQNELYTPSATNPHVVIDKSKLDLDATPIDDTIKRTDIGDIDNGTFQSNDNTQHPTTDITCNTIDNETESQPNKPDNYAISENVLENPDTQNIISSNSSSLLSSEQKVIEHCNEQFEEENSEEQLLQEKICDEYTILNSKNTKEPSELHHMNDFEKQSSQYSENQSDEQDKEILNEQLQEQLKIFSENVNDQQTKDQSEENSNEQNECCPEKQCMQQFDKQEVISRELCPEYIEHQSKDEIQVEHKEQREHQQETEKQVEIQAENSNEHQKDISIMSIDNESMEDDLTNKNFETNSKLQSEQNTITISRDSDILVTPEPSNEIPLVKHRNRKLSWDHTMLIRREGLSQSEVDLHSIGKLPIERKSSFFRKKMDSFLRNTTEMFKKQSFNAKSEAIQRRGSMSISTQSLNETSNSFNSDYNEGVHHTQKEEIRSSMSSLISSTTVGRSNSTLSGCHSEVLNPELGSQPSLVASQPSLSVAQALGDYPSNSVHSLNESYLHDSLLQNRAISMSSGLDSQSWLRRKKSTSKSNRSNRVTWVASEGLTNYFRRMIQDENSKSNQDYSSIPENKSDKYYGKNDSKGRRWSYQRAVSGEDPTPPSRYQDSSLRRKPLTEHSEDNPEVTKLLNEYQDKGVPTLHGFEPVPFSEEVQNTLNWAENKKNIEEFIVKEASPVQAVLCELVSTEADYIKHLRVLVEIFLASAHALQDHGLMLDVATDKLFLNLPDVYNANKVFWQMTFHPMIKEALDNDTPFDPKLMESGFRAIADTFEPYQKYALYHPCANDYLRSLSSNADFSAFLNWCHAHKGCQRLQITDLLVKPIQRVTKYSLILKRISQLIEEEVEKNIILEMDQSTKTYVAELNRSVKQRQELDKAEHHFSAVENYEVDNLQANFQEFKDEEIDEYNYHIFSQSNLRAPMLNCHSQHPRTVIHEGDLRFKDSHKEETSSRLVDSMTVSRKMTPSSELGSFISNSPTFLKIEVRAILFTDLLIICKKQSKGSPYQYKMIRPKYMIDKLVDFPKYGVRNNVMELSFIFVVMVDDLGSCNTCFTLTESSKEPNGSDTLKLWEQKIKEAQYTYNLAVWLNCNPSYHLSELDLELASDYGSGSAKQRHLSQEDYNIERDAKERVVTMMHRSFAWSPTFSTDHSHISSDFASMSITGRESTPAGRRVPGIDVLQNRWKRPSTAYSSRNSRMSSFQKSTSAASHDECLGCNKQIHRAGSSLESTQPTINEDDGLSSVTVKVIREGEIESDFSSTYTTPAPDGYSARSTGGQNTLQVLNSSLILVQSLPDLSLVPLPIRTNQKRRSPSPMTASARLYQTHQDQMKSRLNVQNQYLTPEPRGSSYPPNSPGKASLKRGVAFSYPSQRPVLTRMAHVVSQTDLDNIEPSLSPTPGPSTSAVKSEKMGFVAKFLTAGTSTDKLDKNKEREKDKDKDKDKEKDKGKEKEKDKGKNKGKEKEKNNAKDKQMEKDDGKEKDKQKGKVEEKEKEKEKEKDEETIKLKNKRSRLQRTKGHNRKDLEYEVYRAA